MTRKIGEFLKRIKEPISIVDDISYSRVTIRTNNKGLALRDRTPGREIGTKKQFLIKKNQFLLSKIDARNGAFGIVPMQLDGAIITGNFWTFNFDPKLIDINWFNLFTSSSSFIDICSKASSGTTNRKYLDEDKFLNFELDVPSLDYQKEVATFVSNSLNYLKGFESNDNALLIHGNKILHVLFEELNTKAKTYKMSEIAPIVRRKVVVQKGSEYPELGIRSFGKGTFHKPSLKAENIGTKQLYEIHEGDLLFSNVFAWEGAIAVVQSEDHQRYGSHRFISCVCNSEIIEPEFLWFYFLSTKGLEDIRKASPGSAGRNKTLGLSKLEAIEVPVPPLSDQAKFLNSLRIFKKLQSLNTEKQTAYVKTKSGLLDKYFYI